MHFLIFSGANERAILAACRNLAADKIGYSIIARPRNDPIARSHLRRFVVSVRQSDALDIEDVVRAIAQVRGRLPRRLVYLPASEALNRLVLQHRERLSNECGLEIPMPTQQVYETLSDKARFNALAQQFGVTLPPALASANEAPLPLVAKPQREFSLRTGEKLYPELIFTEAQRSAFLSKQAGDGYFYQGYLDGASHYYLFFFDGKGRHAALFQQNLAQQPNGKSIVAAQSCACPDPAFLEKIQACIASTGFSGFCMVEAMTVAGTSYLIELNPRLWGPMELALRCGFRIAWLGEPDAMVAPALPRRPVRYAWLSGMWRSQRSGGSLRWFPQGRAHFPRHLLSFLHGDIYLNSPRTWPMAWRELRSGAC
jgi:predicted ATP-grasp superfamily ATP-dependent carboligase